MKNKVLNLWKDLIVISFLVLFPHFVPLPFYSYAVVCGLVIFFLLKRDGKKLSDIGLDMVGFNSKSLFIGLVSAFLLVGFMQLIYIPAIKYLFAVPDYTEYNFIRNNPLNLLLSILAAWIIGGFYEEVVFRGYIQSLLSQRLSPSRFGLLSIVLTSVLFGVYHYQQGVFGIISAIFGGTFWGILYKKFHHNLWIVIFSHALFDTITLLLIL